MAEKTYTYTRGGEKTHRVTRVTKSDGSKTFFQEHWEGENEWVYGVGDVPRGLYRIDEIKSETVCWSEGEKCVDELWKAGFQAVTNIGGSNAWSVDGFEPIEQLKEKGVKNLIVFVDDDPPGQKIGLRVAEDAIKAKLKVKYVRLYTTGDSRKDVADWLQNGGTANQLRSIVTGQPTLDKNKLKTIGKKKNYRLKVVTADQLVALVEEAKKLGYLWDRQIQPGSFNILIAREGTGKSCFARCLAASVVIGRQFCGYKCKQGKVLYMAMDEPPPRVAQHFADLGMVGNPNFNMVVTGATVTLELLEEYIDSERPDLIVIDTIQLILQVKQDNSYSETYSATQKLADLASKYKCSIFGLHHANKNSENKGNNAAMGSTGWLAPCEMTWWMFQTDKESPRFFKSEKNRGMGGLDDIPTTELILDGPWVRLGRTILQIQIMRAKTKILEVLKFGAQTNSQLRKETREFHGNHVTTAILELIQDGSILQSGGGSKGNPYVYEIVNI